ncbi:MAG TPA: rhodanese-like domain-containing protein [Myxococcota bacterium]|nr:rhodanese-like domain-containing protein [Myxococcota bacterium]
MGLLILVIALALLLAGVGFLSSRRAADASSEGAPSELLTEIQAGHAPLVLDVRTPEEYAKGHVPGALDVPVDQLESRISELAGHREEPVVVYCEIAPRAVRGAKVLASAGFTSVRLLAGHMSAWRAAGLPIE